MNKEEKLKNMLEEIYKKYPSYREDMTTEQERQFVDDMFTYYETEGFSPIFWASGGDFEEYKNQTYTVVRRVTENDDCDLCVLPMWKIEFENGETINAYPEEIILSEMKTNGWNAKDVLGIEHCGN